MAKEDDKITVNLRREARTAIEKIAKELETTPGTVLEEALALYEGVVEHAKQGKLPYLREGVTDQFARLKLVNSQLEVYLQKRYEQLLKQSN